MLLPLFRRGWSPRFPFYVRLGVPQNQFGRYEEETSCPGRPARSLVATPTELYT
jgi:hypothetical protein